MKKTISIATFCYILSGCASTESNTTSNWAESLNSKKILGDSVYATLEKDKSGKYIFSKISISDTYNNQVDLNTLKPTWNTSTESHCKIGIGMSIPSDRPCKRYNEALFMVSDMDTSQMLYKGFTTAITYGMNGTSRMTNVTFHGDAYIAAVNEALANLKIDRAKLISDVNEVKSNYLDKVKKYNKILREEVNINPIINDESGIFSENKDFFKDISQKLYFDEADIIATVERKDFSNLKATLKSKLAKFDDELSKFNFKCTSLSRPFHGSVQCPESLPTKNKIKSVENTITITGIDIDPLLPEVMEDELDQLNVVYKEKQLNLINLSSSFLEIESISIYYKGNISTQRVNIQLPPDAQDEVDVKSYLSDLPSQRRAAYTYAKAKGEKLNFGFAIKFKIINEDKPKTMYKNIKYIGLDLV